MFATGWPLILAGPIVRRVEPRLACVWVALRAPCTVRLDIWDGLEPASTIKPPFATATVHSLRAADFLHIGLPVIEIGISNAPLLPGHIYSYNLTLTEKSDANTQETLSSLGLLQDRAGVETNDQLTTKPHLALGYQTGMLPSFVLPPTELTNLKLLHASCRRPFVDCPDAMTFLDDFISAARTDAIQRPHQLFLTGDQIYADDVATPMLHSLIDVGNALTGNFPIGAELIGGVEHLPTRWPNQPPGTDSVRLWPATHRYFPAGVRGNAVINDARFTTAATTMTLGRLPARRRRSPKAGQRDPARLATSAGMHSAFRTISRAEDSKCLPIRDAGRDCRQRQDSDRDTHDDAVTVGEHLASRGVPRESAELALVGVQPRVRSGQDDEADDPWRQAELRARRHEGQAQQQGCRNPW